MRRETVKEIGEKELIKRISKYMPRGQTSDDCAYLKINKENLLLNTDLMVENTHFNNKIISAKNLGWKAVSTNFSDLISSGCIEIIGINIGLVLTPNTEWHWVKELYEGFSEALNKFGGKILGGDCSKGENITISITAIGIQGELSFRRNACKPGEILITTGIHGLSKLGYLIQDNQINSTKLQIPKQLVEQSINAFCRPEPKYDTLRKIISLYKEKNFTTIGCTDSSDGFYQGILDLATESNCKAILDYKKIPKHIFWPKGDKWDEYYFYGGEDYELIFSLPKNYAVKLLEIDKKVTEIGFFTKGNSSVEIRNYPSDRLTKNSSYSHF